MMSNSWWWHMDSVVPNHTMITFKEELFGHLKRTDCCWTDSIKAQPAWLWDFPEPHNRKQKRDYYSITLSPTHSLSCVWSSADVSESAIVWEERIISKEVCRITGIGMSKVSKGDHYDHRRSDVIWSSTILNLVIRGQPSPFWTCHHRKWKPFLFAFKPMFWTSPTTIWSHKSHKRHKKIKMAGLSFFDWRQLMRFNT